MLVLSAEAGGVNATASVRLVAHGHECSWGNDKEAIRPPTKQFIQALRTKIQWLEAKLSTLRDSLQSGGQQSEGFSGFDPARSVPDGASFPIPTEFRPILPPVPTQPPPSPWLAYQAEHSFLATTGVIIQPVDTTYQFVFNIDANVPLGENVRQSLLCEWNRHLPLLDGVQFTRLEHDTLLDRYFRYSGCWLMNIVPPLFLHDMLRSLSMSDLPKVDHYSPLLHCSLMAFAVSLSDDPLITQPSTGECFVNQARCLLSKELDIPTLAMMQSLSLLSEYHYGLGEMERGYMYLGMSMRVVRALGLGTRRERLDLAPSAAISNWYFLSVYLQDKIVAPETTGEYGLESARYLLEPPIIDLEIDRLPWLRASGPNPAEGLEQPNRMTEVLSQTCRLIVIGEPIFRLHISESSTEEMSFIFNIHFKLQAWLDQLSPELRILDSAMGIPLPHIISLNICYWWLVLCFYQQLLGGGAALTNATQPLGNIPSLSCDRAAHEIMELVKLYERWHGLRFFDRRMIQVLYTTGRFFLSKRSPIESDNLSPQQQTPSASALECISALHAISNVWQCAKKYADRLQLLMSQQDQGFSAEA